MPYHPSAPLPLSAMQGLFHKTSCTAPSSAFDHHFTTQLGVTVSRYIGTSSASAFVTHTQRGKSIEEKSLTCTFLCYISKPLEPFKNLTCPLSSVLHALAQFTLKHQQSWCSNIFSSSTTSATYKFMNRTPTFHQSNFHFITKFALNTHYQFNINNTEATLGCLEPWNKVWGHCNGQANYLLGQVSEIQHLHQQSAIWAHGCNHATLKIWPKQEQCGLQPTP